MPSVCSHSRWTLPAVQVVIIIMTIDDHLDPVGVPTDCPVMPDHTTSLHDRITRSKYDSSMRRIRPSSFKYVVTPSNCSPDWMAANNCWAGSTFWSTLYPSDLDHEVRKQTLESCWYTFTLFPYMQFEPVLRHFSERIVRTSLMWREFYLDLERI